MVLPHFCSSRAEGIPEDTQPSTTKMEGYLHHSTSLSSIFQLDEIEISLKELDCDRGSYDSTGVLLTSGQLKSAFHTHRNQYCPLDSQNTSHNGC